MTWFSFILALLAVYRVSHLLTQEDGPFDLFSTLREKLGQATWVGRGAACLLCVSFWLSALPAFYLARTYVEFALYWGGIAGGVLVIRKYLG